MDGGWQTQSDAVSLLDIWSKRLIKYTMWYCSRKHITKTTSITNPNQVVKNVADFC